MTSYLKIFVLIDFHFQDAIFSSSSSSSSGARPNEREAARSVHRSCLARTFRCRAKDIGSDDEGTCNSLQTLSDQKFRGATGRTNLKIFPSGVSTAA